MSNQFHTYCQEIRLNYEKLVNAVNLKTERIHALEMELKKSRGLVQNLINRYDCSNVELKELRLKLIEFEQKMKRYKNLYKEQINQTPSTESCTRNCKMLSPVKHCCDENCTDNNLNIIDTIPCISLTCESCAFHKTQLDELNTQICDLMDEIKQHTADLHGNQRLTQVLSKKLDENDKDLKTFAIQLKCSMTKCFRLWSKLQSAQEKINSMETTNTELSRRLHETEEQLINVQHHMNTKFDEIECKKNQDIQYYINTGQELERKLISQEEKLEKCEELKNMYDKKCNDLTIQNNDLQNMLITRNKENTILNKIVEKLDYPHTVANKKVKYLRSNLKICVENLKYLIEENKNLNSESECVTRKLKNNEKTLIDTELRLNDTIEENGNLKSKLECERNKFKNNEKILLDTELRLNTSIEENTNLSSKIKLISEELTNYKNIIHSTELKLNEESSQNNNRKTELATLSNDYKKIISVNNMLCKRIAELEINQEPKCQANIIIVSNSETAHQMCTCTSLESCSCSAGSNSETAHQLCARTSPDDGVCSAHPNTTENSEHDDCTAESEIFKRSPSEYVKIILSIQQKATNTENELKEQCANMAQMLNDQCELQEKVFKAQIKAQNNIIKKMNAEIIRRDKLAEENLQTLDKQTNLQSTNATDSKQNLLYKQNLVAPNDKSSGDKNGKSMLIKDLSQQLEMKIRNKQEMNFKNNFLKRPKILNKRNRV